MHNFFFFFHIIEKKSLREKNYFCERLGKLPLDPHILFEWDNLFNNNPLCPLFAKQLVS